MMRSRLLLTFTFLLLFCSAWTQDVRTIEGRKYTVHHVLAGIRHLLMDVGIGGELERARASARLVLIAAPALAVFLLFWGLS